MDVVVLGCGPSSSVPSLRCVLAGKCRVCMEAHANPLSKNRRLNPSLLVRLVDSQTNILIDCGKTFRESVLRVFPQIPVHAVHAVVLTHGHADALLGLDDLREVQPFNVQWDPHTKELIKIPCEPLRVHCSLETKKEVENKFDYLMEKPPPVSVDGCVPPPAPAYRWVAQVRMDIFKPFQSFSLCQNQLEMMPLPVLHGADYISYGFEFGREFGARFVYISDVSDLTDATRDYLMKDERPIDVLMIDALYKTEFHSTHMNLETVLTNVRRLRPRKTVLTGMSHDFDYEATTQQLQQYEEQEGLVVEMAYDGLCMSFPTVS